MNNRNQFLVLCVLFSWILFVLVNCSQTNQKTKAVSPTITNEQIIFQPSSTASTSATVFTTKITATSIAEPTSTLDPTQEYRRSFIYPPTPYPTLSAENIDQMVSLLQSEECNLPCYLGITPGHTTWEDAKIILEDLGAYFSFNTKENGLTIQNVHLNILSVRNDIEFAANPDTRVGAGEAEIVQYIQFTIDNEIVQRISVHIQTSRFLFEFEKYWSRYSVREIFLKYGIPSDIVTWKDLTRGIGYGITLIYQDLGIVTELGGTQQENSICPQIEMEQRQLNLTLTSLSSGLDIFGSGVSPNNQDLYAPIEETLGVDETGFFNQLIEEPSECFKIKQDFSSP
jgi:hypothetical protein